MQNKQTFAGGGSRLPYLEVVGPLGVLDGSLLNFSPSLPKQQ
jgi:hypothetical protein